MATACSTLSGVGGGTTGMLASAAGRAALAVLLVTALTTVGVGTDNGGGNVVG